jgi:hypothetical protein
LFFKLVFIPTLNFSINLQAVSTAPNHSIWVHVIKWVKTKK